MFHVAVKQASPRPKAAAGGFVVLIILSLSFVVGAGIVSFSFLLIGDTHVDKEILRLRDSDNNNRSEQEVKGDASIKESGSSNETGTLSDKRIIVKMEDLLKRMAQKNTQLNKKLNKKEEEIDFLKNYLSYYDPIDICKHPECRQRDPRGSIWLGRHRGLALMLRKIDSTRNSNMQRYNNLAYIMVPKAGSTTMKSKLNCEGWTETVWLSPTTGRSTWDPLIFTMIRDPGERVASAYSTIMARGRSFARKTYLSLPKPPKNTTVASSAWEEHFQKSIWEMMNSVKKNGWENTKFHWNEHIIPQVEFMRGLNVSHIGCIGSINETLAKLHLAADAAADGEEIRMNQYERNNKMPSVKFGSYAMLSVETKALIREVYEEDYALFDSLCTGSNSDRK